MAQLKSTNITGNLSVSGNILASKIMKLGGTGDEILLANGETTTLSGLGAGTVTSVGITNGGGLSVTGSPITSSGTITISHGDTSTQTSITTGGRTYINSITLDGYGHVTALGTNTETVTDTGATSIEVTGSGNAVTSASYNSSTRKITLTKGTTFLTSNDVSIPEGIITGTGTPTCLAWFDGSQSITYHDKLSYYVSPNDKIGVAAQCFHIDEQATFQYNSTDDCIELVFA